MSDAALGIVTASIAGDSTVLQNTTSSTIYNAMGFMTAYNVISGHRLPFEPSQNFGVSGATLDDLDSNKATILAAMTGDVLVCRSGTNNAAAAVDATTLANMKTKFTSVKNYFLAAGKRFIYICITPRTQNLGVPLTAIMLSTIKDFNAWTETQDNGVTFITVNAFVDMCTPGTDDPNPALFKDETGKLLHDAPAGANVIARRMHSKLTACGYRALKEMSATIGNLFSFGAFSGTGGTKTAPATGTVFDGLNVSGSGGSQARTCSVSADGQRVVFSPLSGDGASANLKIKNITAITSAAGISTGDRLFFWAIVSVGTVSRCDGPWVQATEAAGSSVQYIGNNKAGSTTGFTTSNMYTRGLLRTVTWVTRSGLTGITLEVVCQVDAASNAGTADITVHAMGLYNETTGGVIPVYNLTDKTSVGDLLQGLTGNLASV